MERSVKKAYGFSGFLTNMINVEVPRQIAGDPKPKKFNRGYSLNGLPIDGKIKVRIGISLGGNNHSFCLGGISSEMVGTEPLVNGIDIHLEVSKISVVNKRLA